MAEERTLIKRFARALVFGYTPAMAAKYAYEGKLSLLRERFDGYDDAGRYFAQLQDVKNHVLEFRAMRENEGCKTPASLLTQSELRKVLKRLTPKQKHFAKLVAKGYHYHYAASLSEIGRTIESSQNLGYETLKMPDVQSLIAHLVYKSTAKDIGETVRKAGIAIAEFNKMVEKLSKNKAKKA